MDIVRGQLSDGKVCKYCGEWKPLDGYSNCKTNPDGKQYRCKACFRLYIRGYQQNNRSKVRSWNRASYKARPKPAGHNRNRSRLLRAYGLTDSQRNAMLADQDGRCLICGRIEAEAGKKGLVVDHCHSAGTVRGLLCGPCNTGLGMFKDNTELLLKAALYLENSRR